MRHPLNASDFSSFIMQAQASKAQVIGMANATQDAVNTIKASREFGIVDKGQKLAALMLQVTDVHAMGLQVAQGRVIRRLLLGSGRPDAFVLDQFEKRRTRSSPTRCMPACIPACCTT